MPAKVCYLGDDFLTGAAGYLAGVMLHYGIAFDYVPSAEAPPPALVHEPYALYVVSDYPANRFGPTAMRHVADCVQRGSGLVMLGGWESFYGRLGEYHESPLAEVLPVVLGRSDDRANCAQPCLIQKTAEHPIVEGLPWHQPPGIGGFNAIAAKPDSQTVLAAVRFAVRCEKTEFQFTRGEESPLLVVGQYGRGRTAALVDWGDRRVVQDVAGGQIEVGNWYARFFRNLLVWTGGLNLTHEEKPREL
jgi:uncharacterized membrane protein